MRIPTLADWSRDSGKCSPDEDWAFQKFYGKSFEDAVELFEGGKALSSQEALMYMPGPAFNFYFRAFLAYIASIAANDEYDDSDLLLFLLEFFAEHKPQTIAPLSYFP